MISGHLHRYQLHGLVVESVIVLPELSPAATHTPADVLIEVGPVPTHLDQPMRVGGCYEVEPERFLIGLEGEGRFLVSGGDKITVHAESDADAGEIRRLLLSAPLGALLLQRGLLAFHASAVAVDGAGLLFLGGPCAGKSTMAARFQEQGFRVLSDDISAVQIDAAGQPWILPGAAELKLWPDSRAALGGDFAAMERLHAPSTKAVRRFPERFEPAPVPLREIYLLEPGREAEVAITELSGMRRGAALLQHSYRAEFIGGEEHRRLHYLQTTQLAKTIRLRRLAWPGERFFDRALVQRLAEEVRR